MVYRIASDSVSLQMYVIDQICTVRSKILAHGRRKNESIRWDRATILAHGSGKT